MRCSRLVKSLTVSEEGALSGWCCLTGRPPDGCLSTDDINQDEAASFFFLLSLDLNYKANGWTHTNTAYKSSHLL